MPPRKSLRLQGVDADTGVKLPEKEPSRYFQYESYEENVQHPLRDLELHEILSLKDKAEDLNTISSYLAGVVDNLETKKTTKVDTCENVSTLTKRLKIKVIFLQRFNIITKLKYTILIYCIKMTQY